jgi:hypothetical protein
MDRIALTHGDRRAHRLQMSFLSEVLAALMIGWMLLVLLGVGQNSARGVAPPSSHRPLGEIRCEGKGIIVINVEGKDYGVNGLAASRYPPIQGLWTKETHPEIDFNRLIVHGITLCDW